MSFMDFFCQRFKFFKSRTQIIESKSAKKEVKSKREWI